MGESHLPGLPVRPTHYILALLAAWGLAGCASTPPAPAEPPAATASAAPAPVAASVPAPTPAATPAPAPAPVAVEPAPRAPQTYTVQKGDTLWGIATLFLRDPWLWPEIWHVNPQIENPHLIYPGDVITLYYVEGRPQLAVTRAGEVVQTTEPKPVPEVYRTDLPVTKVTPQIRSVPLEEAVYTIPLDVLRPFLRNIYVIDEDTLEDAPYVMRTADGRLYAGSGGKVFVRGLDEDEEPAVYYTLVRSGREYEDPDSGDTLGYEAMYIGAGVLLERGDPATFQLTDSQREVAAGDRLIPADERDFEPRFLPRAPATEIDARLISVVDGVSQIGQYQVVVINKGAADGLEVGHVLEIYQEGGQADDPVAGGFLGFFNTVELPEQRAGLLLVFRTFERVSYGLVMRAESEIQVFDRARSPRAR